MKLLILSILFSCMLPAREWDAHDLSLRSQVEKIREKEGIIGELIQKKNSEKDSQALQNALQEIAKEHKELEKLYQELEEEKRHVRFEHPDEGAKVERKYKAYKLRSIEDMEGESGVDGKLTKLKFKAFQKYGVESGTRQPQSKERDSTKGKTQQKVVDPIFSPKLSY